MDVHGDHFTVDANVVTEPYDATDGQKWDVFYCDNEWLNTSDQLYYIKSMCNEEKSS